MTDDLRARRAALLAEAVDLLQGGDLDGPAGERFDAVAAELRAITALIDARKVTDAAPERLLPEEEFPDRFPGIPERLDWGRLQVVMQASAPISAKQPAREILYDWPIIFDADGYTRFDVLDCFGQSVTVLVNWRQLVAGMPFDMVEP